MALKVFLSYQHESKLFVKDFRDKLKIYAIEGWIDEVDIVPGESLIERISDGITGETSAVIAFISRKALDSRWVKEELKQAKTREIEDDNFMLIPVLLGDIEVDELPAYLRGTKCILWEKEKPKIPEKEHPGFSIIVKHLYKNYLPNAEEVSNDYRLLAEALHHAVISYGHQRRMTQENPENLIYGEFRQKFSKILIPFIHKYDCIHPNDNYTQLCDFINIAVHADIALMDWSLCRDNTDFQKQIINDMLKILKITNNTFGPVDAANEIQTKIEQYRDNILFQTNELQSKTSLNWSINIMTIFYKYSLFKDNDDLRVNEANKIIRLIQKDPYLAWKQGPWLYPNVPSVNLKANTIN
ncbi:toll/interleukin-1 receptor domain-containing protein [bacterium]|nr:toll/interleukin-1 receptor domain-containing protein [bacterium]